MRRAWSFLAAALSLLGCASLPTLTERPEEYRLYRAARIAPSLEERLHAADRYLHEVPRGRHARQLRSWFDATEERYYLNAFDRLANLYAYRAALPNGPHREEVRTRIAWLEQKRARLSRKDGQELAEIAATQARLDQADAARRAFVKTVRDWVLRLSAIETFGEPTSELGDDTIYAFRLSEPHGSCHGDSCRKLVELRYQVPGQRELVERAALLEVQLDLERGLLKRVRLAGPALWTRLAEALSLTPLPNPTPAERADAVARAAVLVRALLEPKFPAAECEAASPASPLVVERRCHGLVVHMSAAAAAEDDDALELAPAGP